MSRAMTDIAALVARSRSPETRATFDDRVDQQAQFLRERIEAGDLDAEDFAVGLELELYATGPDGRLTQLPAAAFETAANKELGLHNAEINTDATALTAGGMNAQAAGVEMLLKQARAASDEADLVLDAMWTIPPAAGSWEYLGATTEVDGVTLARNMRPDPRYAALDNAALDRAGGTIEFDVPGATCSFPSILFESLATSIQPHLQIPDSDAFPAYYNAAIRTMGPVLALTTNSPLLPGDLYDEVADPETLLEDTHHELRIAAFEQSMNQDCRKVRVPRDIEATTDVVDRVAADTTLAPYLREWLEDPSEGTFGESFWEFDYKRSTYWRWLRCVVGGDAVEGAGDGRTLRIEYRPIPTQPSVPDIAAAQALTVGLIRGLVATDHPITDLPWDAAEESFYNAVHDGIEADLHWVTADGERTGDTERIFEEVFRVAREGLHESGLSEEAADDALAPLTARWERRVTPSTWKLDRVREELADGHSLSVAIERMQRTYIERQRDDEPFVSWVTPNDQRE